jgi:hypothetical protein
MFGNMNRQMRRGLTRLTRLDSSLGVFLRDGKTHTERCRVSYKSGGVWSYGAVDAGANFNTTPYLLTDKSADVREGDILHWRDGYFQVGAVSFPSLDGGRVCLQAELREIGKASWTVSDSA